MGSISVQLIGYCLHKLAVMKLQKYSTDLITFQEFPKKTVHLGYNPTIPLKKSGLEGPVFNNVINLV